MPTRGTNTAYLGGTFVDVTGDTMTGALVITPSADGADNFRVNNNAGTSLFAINTSTSAISLASLTVDTNTLYVDTTNNRVGVLTTTPEWDITIGAGAQRFAGVGRKTDAGNGDDFFNHAGGAKIGASNADGGIYVFSGGQHTGTGVSKFIGKVGVAGVSGTTDGSFVSLLYGTGDNGGTIGIGNTTPAACKVEIKQESALQGLFLNQDGNGIALNIDTEATTTNGIVVSATLMTTGNGINITDLDALTTGGIFRGISNSASTSSRSLLYLQNDNTLATGAIVATFIQDAIGIALDITSAGTSIRSNSGSIAIALGATQSVSIDANTADHTDTAGVLVLNIDHGADNVTGMNLTSVLRGNYNSATYAANLTGYATGGTTGNVSNAYHATITGSANDTNHFYVGYNAGDFAATGGAGSAIGFRNGTGFLYGASFDSGDVLIEDNAKGLILKDTQATPHYWRVSVSTLGVLTTADLGTSPP